MTVTPTDPVTPSTPHTLQTRHHSVLPLRSVTHDVFEGQNHRSGGPVVFFPWDASTMADLRGKTVWALEGSGLR